MTEDQRRQVFKVADSGAVTVRDDEAQKAYFANRAAQMLVEQERQDGMKKVERVGWRVEAGKVWLKEEKVESGITRRDLLTMLRDLGE
jgi:ribosomal protein S11